MPAPFTPGLPADRPSAARGDKAPSTQTDADNRDPVEVTSIVGPAPLEDEHPTVISGARQRSGPFDPSVGLSLAGRKLGHFELIESVGAGGMAAVLKARDLDLGRVVALKILPPDMATEPENVVRFKQEARAAAKLDHENVARVYYIGEDQGLHFIAFAELIERDSDNLRLQFDQCWIDAHTLTQAEPGQPVLEGNEWMRACRSPLLEDLDGTTQSFDEWLHIERRVFRSRLVHLCEARLQRLSDSKAAPEERAAAALRLIELDAAHEGAACIRMKAFAELGQRAEALREYERCHDALRRLLDAVPSRETTALYEAIRNWSTRPAAEQPANPPRPLASADPLFLTIGEPNDVAPVIAAARREPLPSIAVLPLNTLAPEANHQLVATAIVEDLIELLSRVPTFFVISRLSTRVFQSRAAHPHEIARLLGVRYVLSGTLRPQRDKLRLSIELTDAESSVILWSRPFSFPLTAVSEVEIDIAAEIIRRLAPYLREAELTRVRSKNPDTLEAYDLLLQAQEQMHNSARATFDRAGATLTRAVERDPNWSLPHAWLAYWHVLRVGQGWSPDRGFDTGQADLHGDRALDLDGTDSMALAVHGHVASYLHKDFDVASSRFNRAIEINPNNAAAWHWNAGSSAWMGNGPAAVRQIDQALALTPYDPLLYAIYGVAEVAYLVDRQFDKAIAFGEASLRENQTYTGAHRFLAIAHAMAGDLDKARTQVGKMLALEPGTSVSAFRARYPGARFPHAAEFCDALRRAGLPD